ncbi:hypothetical protein F4780DRAFT_720750 [Xylariomycetidae sp. FL0641]|nr:hypothetical protein F4780DRAFT_720750 [Xylariomycetidae sp. FL0641]
MDAFRRAMRSERRERAEVEGRMRRSAKRSASDAAIRDACEEAKIQLRGHEISQQLERGAAQSRSHVPEPSQVPKLQQAPESTHAAAVPEIPEVEMTVQQDSQTKHAAELSQTLDAEMTDEQDSQPAGLSQTLEAEMTDVHDPQPEHAAALPKIPDVEMADEKDPQPKHAAGLSPTLDAEMTVDQAPQLDHAAGLPKSPEFDETVENADECSQALVATPPPPPKAPRLPVRCKHCHVFYDFIGAPVERCSKNPCKFTSTLCPRAQDRRTRGDQPR